MSSYQACWTAGLQFFDNKASLTLNHLVFLSLEIHDCQWDFKVLVENNNLIFYRIFYLQLLNKDNESLQ